MFSQSSCPETVSWEVNHGKDMSKDINGSGVIRGSSGGVTKAARSVTFGAQCPPPLLFVLSLKQHVSCHLPFSHRLHFRSVPNTGALMFAPILPCCLHKHLAMLGLVHPHSPVLFCMISPGICVAPLLRFVRISTLTFPGCVPLSRHCRGSGLYPCRAVKGVRHLLLGGGLTCRG